MGQEGEVMTEDRPAVERADEIGQLAHEAWKRWRVEGGYPDHAWMDTSFALVNKADGTRVCAVQGCGQIPDRHHEDMIDWADLRPEKRQKYIVQGMAGYEARQADTPEDIAAEFELAMRAIEMGNTNGGAAVVGLKNGWVDARQRAEAAEARIAELEQAADYGNGALDRLAAEIAAKQTEIERLEGGGGGRDGCN